MIRGYTKDTGNQVSSNSTDYVNNLNRLYARFHCHVCVYLMDGVRDRLANATTHRNGQITVGGEEVVKVKVLQNQSQTKQQDQMASE